MMNNKGQISAEMILILAAILTTVLLTAQFTINYQNKITEHTKTVINTTRNTILSKL